MLTFIMRSFYSLLCIIYSLLCIVSVNPATALNTYTNTKHKESVIANIRHTFILYTSYTYNSIHYEGTRMIECSLQSAAYDHW